MEPRLDDRAVMLGGGEELLRVSASEERLVMLVARGRMLRSLGTGFLTSVLILATGLTRPVFVDWMGEEREEVGVMLALLSIACRDGDVDLDRLLLNNLPNVGILAERGRDLDLERERRREPWLTSSMPANSCEHLRFLSHKMTK